MSDIMESVQMDKYLSPTGMIDSDHPAIMQKAEELAGGTTDTVEAAKRFFYFARDAIEYSLYEPRSRPEHFRASGTLVRKTGFCVTKAVLLAALARARGIPARLGFATIRLHIVPPKLMTVMKTNDLPDHGFAELFLNGRWVKATPSFDIAMCGQHDFIPIEFDGERDAQYHPCTRDGRQHIEYVSFKDRYDDVPVDSIIEWLDPLLTPKGKSLILDM